MSTCIFDSKRAQALSGTIDVLSSTPAQQATQIGLDPLDRQLALGVDSQL